MSNLRFNYFDVDDPSKTRATIQLWDGDDWLGVIFLRKQDFLPDDDPEPHTPCWQVSGINVLEPFRRKGFGTKLYEEAARVAEKYGKSLCSDTPIALDPKALAFWEKQVEKGRAYWEVPGPSENEGVNYDYGRFVLKQPVQHNLSGVKNLGIKHLGYIYPGNLPDDMQILIMDLAVMLGEWPDDKIGLERMAHTQFPLLKIPLKFFPEIDPESDDMDERDFESYLETPISEYPPVVIAHNHLIDGRHRVWAARKQGASTINTIDISCLVYSAIQGSGPMKFPSNVRIPKCKGD